MMDIEESTRTEENYPQFNKESDSYIKPCRPLRSIMTTTPYTHSLFPTTLLDIFKPLSDPSTPTLPQYPLPLPHHV